MLRNNAYIAAMIVRAAHLTRFLLLIFAFCAIVQAQSIIVHNLFENPTQGQPAAETGYYVIDPAGTATVIPTGQSYSISGNHDVQTQYPVYSGVFQNMYHKFSRWDDNVMNYGFTKSINVIQNDEYSSYLDITRNAQLHSTIEAAAGWDDIRKIRFRDPWNMVHQSGYVYSQSNYPDLDDFTELDLAAGEGDYSNSTNPGKHGGVFLNISQNPPGYDQNPFYSIRAPLYYGPNGEIRQNGDTLGYGDVVFQYFKRSNADVWNDHYNYQPYHRTKAVVFKDDNATLTAWYKAHMESNSTPGTPTSTNSQRKIDVDSRGVYHAVYESSNEIWYTTSRDQGYHWTPEIMVSDTTGSSRRPCIVELNGTVYISFLAGDNSIVVYKGNAGNFSKIFTIPVEDPDIATPSIEVNNGCQDPFPDLLCVVWEDMVENQQTNKKYYFIRYFLSETDLGRFSEGILSDSSVVIKRWPTIATQDSSVGFLVAWFEGGQIKYREINTFRCRESFDLGTYLLSIENVSSGYFEAIGAPSLTFSMRSAQTIGYPSIVYEAKNRWQLPGPPTWIAPLSTLSGVRRVVVQQRSIDTPTPWYTTNYSWRLTLDTANANPSIGAEPDECTSARYLRGLRVAFNYYGLPYPEIWVIQLRNLVTCSKSTGFQVHGFDPAMTPRTWNVGRLHELYCYSAWASFMNEGKYLQYSIANTDNQLSKNCSVVTETFREAFVSDDTLYAATSVHDPRIQHADSSVDPIEWDPCADSLVIGVNTTLDEKMRSAVFEVADGDSLLFDRERYTNDTTAFPPASAFVLRIRDGVNGTVLLSSTMPLSSFPSDSAGRDVFAFDLSPLAGQQVYMTIGVSDTLLHYSQNVSETTTAAEVESKRAGDDDAGPTPAYPVLEQNYPNPFNPSTGIFFTVPANGAVKLTVTDNVGRVVSILLDGYLTAGRHYAAFHGGNLPSGTYFYRLEAGGQSATRAMTLLK